MSSSSIPRRALALALALGACLAAAVPGCAVFGGGGPSTVAQGKYYSSGNPEYDEFFIALYRLQVEMAEAPQVPNAERQSLARTLGLAAETPADGVTQRLHEEALKLGSMGNHLRLEPKAPPDEPAAASATLRATYPPSDTAAARLIANVEASASHLLRTAGLMKKAEITLLKLEVDASNLEPDVPKAFAEAHVGKQSEVHQNLADAQKLITLMKARGGDVRAQCEQFFASIAQAVNTDDGSLDAPTEASAERAGPQPKKGAPKAHAKPKTASPAPASSAPAAAPKPKPPAPPPAKPKPGNGDDDAAARPAPPSKPAPAPRDFEP